MASSGEEITIQRGCSLPALNRCTSCCSLYHCPFCTSAFFKPSKKSKVQTHLQLHFSRAVVHEDYTIHRCGLGCVSQLHYHCVYCSSIKIRRDHFVAHLKGCKNASTSTTILDVPPLTASTSTTIPDVAPLTASTSNTILDVPPLTASTSTTIPDVPPLTASTSNTIPDVAPLTASRSSIKPQLRNSVVIKTKCPLCHITVQKKNLRKHLERKHTKSRDDITHSDQIRFIMDVLFPESIICALAVVGHVSILEAEEKFLRGPVIDASEREHFDMRIKKQLKKSGKT